MRFQLLGAIVIAVLLPGLFGPNVTFWYPGTNPSQDNTAIATLIAVLVGFYFMNKINNFPGVGASSFILVTFFTLMAVILTGQTSSSRPCLPQLLLLSFQEP